MGNTEQKKLRNIYDSIEKKQNNNPKK